MPVGFQIASAYVDINADTTGLRRDAQQGITTALRGLKGKVQLKADATGFATDARAAIKKATAKLTAKAKLGISSAGLKAEVQRAVTTATASVKPKVRLGISTVGLREEIQAAITAATAGQHGTVTIDANFDRDRLQRLLDDDQPTIRPNVDALFTRAKLMAALSGLDIHTDVTINPDIDKALFTAKVQAEMAALRNKFTVAVTPDVNTTLFAVKLQAAAHAVSGGLDIDLNPQVNALKARAELAAKMKGLRINTDVSFSPQLNELALASSIAKAKAALDAMGRNLHFRTEVDIDEAQARAAFARLNSMADSSGSHMSRLGKIIAASFVLGGPAIAASLHVLEAIGPAAAVSIPMVASLGTVFATVAVGGNGVVNAITSFSKGAKQFDEAMGHLTPTAQSFVKAIITTKGAFHDLQQSVQNVLFDGLDTSFRDMAKTVIPDLRIGLGGTAIQLNEMAKGAMGSVESLSKMGLLKTMFGGLQTAFQPLVPMPGEFLNMLTKTTIAASPLLIKMTTAFGNGVSDLNTRINNLFTTGLLQKYITDSGNKIKKFFQDIANNPEWKTFTATMQKTGPQVAAAIAHISEALLKLINNLGPLSGALVKIIDGFAKLVIALPDGLVQTVLGVAAGLKLLGLAVGGIIAVGKAVIGLSTALGLLKDQQLAVAALNTRLGATGAAATTAGRGVGVLAGAMRGLTVVGIAGGLIAGATIGIQKLKGSAVEAAPDVDKLVTSLNNLTSNGVFTGQLKTTFGDMDGLVKQFKELSKAQADFNKQGDPGDTPGSGGFDKIQKTADSLKTLTDRYKAVDSALSKMVASGNGKQASADFSQMTTALTNAGVPLKDITKVFPQYTQATKDAKDAQTQAAATMGAFGNAAIATGNKLNTLKTDTDGLVNSLFALNNTSQDTSNAVGTFEDSLDNLNSAAGKGSVGLKLVNGVLVQTTSKQRDAATAMTNTASASEAAGLAIYNQTGSWEQAQGAWKKGHDALVSAGQAFGLSKKDAEAYANSILKIPSQKQIRLELITTAQQQLNDVVSAFRAAPDKKTITVTALSDTAVAKLTDLGFTVKKLPDGSFSVTAKTAGAASQLKDLQNVKIGDKDVRVTADTKQFTGEANKVDARTLDSHVSNLLGDITGFKSKAASADGTKLASHISQLLANISPFNSSKGKADGSSLKSHTSSLLGNLNPFLSAKGRADGTSLKSHSSAINGNTSGFAGAVSRVAGWAMPSKTINIVANVVGAAKSLLGFASGGLVPGFAVGGSIAGAVLQGPGSTTSDSLLARLSKGEFVMQAAAVEKYGSRFMAMINGGVFPKLPGYAAGGAAPAGDIQDPKNVTALQGLVTVSEITQRAIKAGSVIDDETMSALRAQDSLASLLSGIQSTKNATLAAFKGATETKLLTKIDSTADQLIPLQRNLDSVNKSLDGAKSNLDSLTSTFNSLKSSVSSNVTAFANITKLGKYGTSADTLISQLTTDAGKAQDFSSSLAALKAKGLNSSTLADIGAAGVEGGGLASAHTLLTATPEQIAQINALADQVAKSADAAGDTVANSMYGAGIQAAQGLVDGLQSQQDSLESQMRIIAQGMEDALKQALGIASPSKRMMVLGDHTAEGYALGIENNPRPKAAAMAMAGSTISTVSSTGSGGGGGVTYAGGITININGAGMDLTNPATNKKAAQLLATNLKAEMRLSDRRRK